MTDSAPASQTCAVVGGGPAGLIAALALAHFGVPAVLLARRPTQVDNRTTALLASSVAALEALGVWAACRAHAAPLRVLRIADDTGRLWRAPEVRFDAAEIGLEAFGWNIENRHLVAALWDRVSATPEQGRSYELWLIAKGAPTPKSLGLVGSDEFTQRTIPSNLDLATLRSARYAVSLEPAGGSPSGVPTGPVLFTGNIVESVPTAPRS